jgi:hypothetical protein
MVNGFLLAFQFDGLLLLTISRMRIAGIVICRRGTGLSHRLSAKILDQSRDARAVTALPINPMTS